jgi:hypothetical protein
MCSKWIILGAVVLPVVATANRATAQQATLDLQEKCSKQAQIAFDKIGFQERENASFTNHYNVKSNRCLIETEQDAVPSPFSHDIFWTYKVVSDAYEGTAFASYAWHSDKVKKYWEMPPVECKVTLPSGDDELCKSSEEFDKMVKIYMQ